MSNQPAAFVFRRVSLDEFKAMHQKETVMQMQDGQKVEVHLHGDEQWHAGEVIKARKMWVQISACPTFPGGFIADEGSIAEWRPAPVAPSAPPR